MTAKKRSGYIVVNHEEDGTAIITDRPKELQLFMLKYNGLTQEDIDNNPLLINKMKFPTQEEFQYLSTDTKGEKHGN